MIKRLLLAVLIGALGHQSERWLDELFPTTDLNRLSKYAAGGSLILLAFPFVHLGLWRRWEEMIRALVAMILDLFTVGAGVVMFGYLIDAARGKR